MTSAYFNLVGKIPDDSNLLQMWFKGELINGELNFNIFTEFCLYPWEFFYFNDLIIFSISKVDVFWYLIVENGLVKAWYK